MKKKIALFLCLALVLSCVALAACGDSGKKDLTGSKYVGTWKATHMSLGEETGEFDSEIFLVLNPDGTAQFTSGEEVSNCTWEETGNGFMLKGDSKMTFTDDGDGVKSTILGVDLHLVKEP